MKEKQLYISFGSGVRLMAEDVYVNEVQGISLKGFRALCRALMVPMIEIGKTRFVETTSFLLAMRAICRIGEKDFLVPGSERLRRGHTRGTVTALDPEEFAKNMSVILDELIAAKTLSGGNTSEEVKTAASKAADRLATTALRFLPSIEQGKHDKQAKKIADNEKNTWQHSGSEG